MPRQLLGAAHYSGVRAGRFTPPFAERAYRGGMQRQSHVSPSRC
jgi:hypothetical protein